MSRLKKLTPNQVQDAIDFYQSGKSLQETGELFGVSRQAMWDLLRRRIELRSQKRHGAENHFYRGGSYEDERAHDLLEKAVLRGDLIRPDNCEQCNASGRMKDGRTIIQGHHDDYNEPLRVRWLCQQCHHEWHKNNTAIPRKEVIGELAAVDIICGGFP